jgi:hypothetical protein
LAEDERWTNIRIERAASDTLCMSYKPAGKDERRLCQQLAWRVEIG